MGNTRYDNTATITDDGVAEESSASVDVNVQCLIFDGETATGEGLPWKATKRAPNNWFMYTTWTDIADGGADIIAGQFYDVGDVTGSRNGTTTLTFELDGDWELADTVGNVKINPMSCTTNQNYKQPGQFANSFTVDPDDSGSFSVSGLPNTECYGIHLSVGQWVPDPNFPPDAAVVEKTSATEPNLIERGPVNRAPLYVQRGRTYFPTRSRRAARSSAARSMSMVSGESPWRSEALTSPSVT